MRVIWKETIRITGRFDLKLPRGAEVVSFQMQQGMPTIWFSTDPDSPPEPRSFVLVGTGMVIPEWRAQFIGTIQDCDGAIVWHLFEIRKEGR